MVLACDTVAVRQRLPFDTHTPFTRRFAIVWLGELESCDLFIVILSSPFDSSAIVYYVRQRGKRLRRIIHRVEIFLLKGKKKSNKKGAQKDGRTKSMAIALTGILYIFVYNVCDFHFSCVPYMVKDVEWKENLHLLCYFIWGGGFVLCLG